MGSCWIFRSCHGRRVCDFFQKKKIYRTETGICTFKSVPADSFCRTCAQWIFLCIQPLDLGIWNADRLYSGAGISGTVCLTDTGKKTDFYYAAGILCACTFFGNSPYRAEYHGCNVAGSGCVYSSFLWKYFCAGKISLWNDRYCTDSKYSFECVISVFL